MKQLGNNLNTSAEQRCTFANCVDLVRKGSHVYFWVKIQFHNHEMSKSQLAKHKYIFDRATFTCKPKYTAISEKIPNVV